MQALPPFSVLMSVYAKEQPVFLQECLASLVAQTQPAAQVVVVCDGELGEALQQVLAEFAKRLPLKLVPLPHNVGLGRALAVGLQHCEHEWVCRMDSDDIAVPERFAKQLAFIAQHPRVAVCGGQIIEFNQTPSDGKLSRQVPTSQDTIARYAKTRNPINHMTVAFKKSAVLTVGNYRHALWYEDYDLWVRLLLAGFEFANLAEVLVYARADVGLYQRRGGWQYARQEWAMQRQFYQQGFLSAAQLAKNTAIRLPVRLLPNQGRAWLYQKLLRR